MKNKTLLIFAAAAIAGLWACPVIAEEESSVDMAAVIEAIGSAADMNEAGQAFSQGVQQDPHNVELHAAYLAKALKLGHADRAFNSAEELLEHRPDDGYVWAVAAYGYARYRQYGKAIDVATHAATLLPEHPVVMSNLGQLMAWLANQDPREFPELANETKVTLAANQNTWPANQYYAQGFAKIQLAHNTYAQQLQAKADELAALREAGERLEIKLDELKQNLKSSQDLVARMQAAGGGGGEVGIGADGGGGQQNPYANEIKAERDKQTRLRTAITATTRELRDAGRQFTRARRALQMFENRRRSIVEEAGGRVALEAPSLAVAEEAVAEGGPSPADTRTEVIVDNDDLTEGTLGGTWQVIDGRPIALVDTLLHDNNEGKGDKFVIFRPNLPGAGRYHVYFNNLAHSQAATNVPIEITHAGGTATVSLNQQTSGNGWVLLGTFNFAAGAAGQVTIQTAGTNGYVLVDAVKFSPAY